MNESNDRGLNRPDGNRASGELEQSAGEYSFADLVLQARLP